MFKGCYIFCQLEILRKIESMQLFYVVDNGEIWTNKN